MFKRLIGVGANIKCYSYALPGYPLIWSIKSGDLNLCKFMLDHGADPNCYVTFIGEPQGLVSEIGRTALMIAAEMNRSDIVNLLLQSGADSATRGIEGKTAYQLLERKKGSTAVLKLLKSDINRSGGRFPASVASSIDSDVPTSENFGSFEDMVSWLERMTKGISVVDEKDSRLQWLSLSAESARRIAGLARSRGTAAIMEDFLRCIAHLQKRASMLDTYVFLRQGVLEGAQLCLMNHADQWDVLLHHGTACVNYGVTHRALVAFLKRLDARCPFRVHECDTGVVGGTFINRPKVTLARELAKQLSEFCPFTLEPHDDSVVKLGRSLQRTGRFKLWWD